MNQLRTIFLKDFETGIRVVRQVEARIHVRRCEIDIARFAHLDDGMVSRNFLIAALKFNK